MQQKYRPDIDGLRAVAVLSVVIYHAWSTVLTGGFIGVDIFFVISGFLISGIIFRNLEANNFSFIDFYQKRIRRIFPSLLIVLTSCLIVGWRILLPDEFQQLGKHMLSGGGFFINFVLKKEAGYFDTAVELKPLLHLWSLAIEEQFYIIWPALLWLGWKRKWSLWKMTATIFIISFARSVYMVEKHQTYTFFMLDTRLWELAAGALLAYFKLYGKPIKSTVVYQLSSVIGVILLIVGLLLIDKTKAFPASWALLPVSGAICVIFAGKDAWINRFILSSKPMVWIGLISYPLYLWHWSIFSFATIMQQDQNKLLLIFLSFFLAWLTYFFVEKPIRCKKYSRCIITSCTSMLLILSLGFLVYQQQLKSQSDRKFSELTLTEDDISNYATNTKINNIDVNTFGNSNSLRRILFVGDSHMSQNYPRVKYLSENKSDFFAIFLTMDATSSIEGLIKKSQRNPSSTYAEHILDVCKQENINTVVIQNRWMLYLNPDSEYYFTVNNNQVGSGTKEGENLFFGRLSQLILKLKANDIDVYVISGIPEGKEFSPHAMVNRSLWNGVKKRESKKVLITNKAIEINNKMIHVTTKTGAHFIDPSKYLCDENYCQTMMNNKPIYVDDSHLKASFVEKHIMYLDKIVK